MLHLRLTRLFALLPTILLLSACEDTPTPPIVIEHPKGWSLVESAPVSPTGQRHDDVFFLDRDTGWIVNTRGEVWTTADGAESWEQLYSTNDIRFRAIGFATSQLGWAGNINRYTNPVPSFALFETTDGGRSWANISDRIDGPMPEGICGIQVLNGNTIFAVGRWHGPAIFLVSRDGGQTWTSRDLSPLATGLVDVYFRDAMNGFVVGGAGVGDDSAAQDTSRTVILRTADGGESWQTVFSSAPRATWGWKISFPTATHGFVSNDGFARGAIVRTSDGGATWSEVNVGTLDGFQGIGFISPDSGWAAGYEILYETADGGDTWTQKNIGFGLNRFRFFANGDGYAVGQALHRFVR